MRFPSVITLLFGVCLVVPALAAEPVPRKLQVIPVYSVSPGASGSVSSSASSQRYEIIGGRAVPEGYSSQYGSRSGSSSVQQQGGIRQSIEYPDGRRVESYSQGRAATRWKSGVRPCRYFPHKAKGWGCFHLCARLCSR